MSTNARTVRSLDGNYGVLDCESGIFVVKPNVCKQHYNSAFDGERFVYLDRNRKCKSGARFVLVSDSTELMLDSRFFNAVKDIDVNLVGYHRLVQAVPGCGTSYIIRNCRPGDLVLTSTREAAEDLRSRLQVSNGDFDIRNVRTVDSYVLNSTQRYNTVWIDEALMRHAGDIIIVAYRTRARDIRLLGDVAQIPYICRVPEARLKYHLIADFVAKDKTEVLSTSHRIPCDVAARIASYYPDGGYRSTNLRTDTVKLCPINSVEEVPSLPDVKCLVFK